MGERFRRQRHSEFDPKREAFESFPSDKPDAAVRQLMGARERSGVLNPATDR
jgi:streptogramin lyase